MKDNLEGYVSADQEHEPVPSQQSKFLAKVVISSAFHPLEYGKVLMQVGLIIRFSHQGRLRSISLF
jgi:hypothetical protein